MYTQYIFHHYCFETCSSDSQTPSHRPRQGVHGNDVRRSLRHSLNLRRALPTSMDLAKPKMSANDGQMFNKMQLTNGIAAGINTAPIPERTTDSMSTYNEPLPSGNYIW